MKKHVACEMRQVADDMEGEWLGWVWGKGEGKQNQHFCSCMQNDLTGTRVGSSASVPVGAFVSFAWLTAVKC